MVTTELGSCEWFVWDLRRSNLIDRGQLDQVVGEFMHTNPGAEPPQLAEYLVQNEVLTQFQSDRLLQGKTQGFVLGPFTLMDSLGVGSMGTVYKAVSKTDNNWYAVKVLPRRSMWNVRIARRKVRAFEACRHPTVVPFVDVGTSGGMHYLAWPFVEGETLENVVQRVGKLGTAQTLEHAFGVAEGMEVCHVQGLFHGLFKPSNLMITPEGDLCILDFGIGCLLAETEGESLVDTMSTANSVASGLDCASPESIMDPTNLNPVGDQYSLGCVMYFCLTGQYPFPDGSAAEKMMAHQFKQPAPIQELNPDVPQEVVDFVERLMQKAPDDRFGSTAEVVEELRSLSKCWPAETESTDRTASYVSEQSLLPQNELPVHAPLSPSSDPGHPTPRPLKAAAVLNQLGRNEPPDIGPLPDRQSLRDDHPSQPPAPADQPENDDRVIPGGENVSSRRSWEERLGPIGIGVGAIIAGVVAWLAVSRLLG